MYFMDLTDIGVNTRNWIDSAQDRDYWRTHVSATLDLQVPYAMAILVLSTPKKEKNKVQPLMFLKNFIYAEC